MAVRVRVFLTNYKQSTLCCLICDIQCCDIPLQLLKHGTFRICSHDSKSARSGNATRSKCATCGNFGDLRECDAFRGSIIAYSNSLHGPVRELHQDNGISNQIKSTSLPEHEIRLARGINHRPYVMSYCSSRRCPVQSPILWGNFHPHRVPLPDRERTPSRGVRCE